MKIRIPEGFLEIAKLEGVPEQYAGDFYLKKVGKRGTDDIIFALTHSKVCKNESEARTVLARVWKTFKRKNVVDTITEPGNVKVGKYKDYVSRAYEELEKAIGQLPKPKYNSSLKNQKDRIAVAGDFHFPFANKEALLELYNDPADTLIVMGDWFDMYAASRYRSTIDYITVREELAIGAAYLRELSTKFKEIYFIKGNHDCRSQRRLQEAMPQILPLIVHPVDLISKGIDNVKVISSIVPETSPMVSMGEDIELDFIGQYKDCIFGHFEEFCGPDAPRKAEKWLNEWSHVLKFNYEPSVIAQAHIHRLQAEFTPKGKLLLGTGCMCTPMPYQLESHGKYAPPVLGYVALYNNNGITNLRKTELIPLMV